MYEQANWSEQVSESENSKILSQTNNSAAYPLSEFKKNSGATIVSEEKWNANNIM